MAEQIPQDNLPPEVFIPLAIVLWGAVAYIYIIKPWLQSRKDQKR